MNWNWYISVAAVQDVMRTAGWRGQVQAFERADARARAVRQAAGVHADQDVEACSDGHAC
ncbi:MAG TPA: hypothetical protein VNH11_27560 [Pirellulales bacterium]|nr:hypothetical protein [Pirellulales bacterium]